jgi:hypothetical protein
VHPREISNGDVSPHWQQLSKSRCVGNEDIAISSSPICFFGIPSLVDLVGLLQKARVLHLVIRLSNGRVQYHSRSFGGTQLLIVSDRRRYYLLWLDSLVGTNCIVRSVPTASNC